MKLIDKFLKVLNTNRNTFATYILTLITVYIAVDRIVEMLLMIFTGISTSYWGPIKYTFALACPVFAYLFSCSSSYANSKAKRVTLFYAFMIAMYIIAISMFTQWLNMGGWLLLLSVPNYAEIAVEFSDLIRRAFCSISLYLPLTTFYPFMRNKILLGINDNETMQKSIHDYKGIDLSNKAIKHGPYTCDLCFFYDTQDGKKITFGEERRYQSLLVCGASGTGKTSMVFEPMIAQDIEKKFFYKEASKELGFTALKTGIANLVAPYSNEYMTKNFTLNLLTPAFGKETLYKTFVQKMTISSSSNMVYKDLGLTYMSPDFETLEKMMNVCKNYGINYYLIDPSHPADSQGLNPFVYDDPSKIAMTISNALQGMSGTEANEIKETYREDITIQIIENLSILLKVIYPEMHDGALPNMEDLLMLLSDFDVVEKMCKILSSNEELAQEYEMQLAYFKRNFYADGKGKADTEKYVYPIASKLENLLRAPSIKNILCNRHNNINFDESLAKGDFIFLCTRRGETGKMAHKTFGLFFLLSMQNAVLRRPGNEKSRVPHFLYIDEFPDFLTKETETMFTMSRKYRVGTTISAQSITQLCKEQAKDYWSAPILSNCLNKIFTGGATVPELEWWETEIGQWKKWSFKQDFNAEKLEMGSTFKEPKYGYTIKMPVTRLQNLGNKNCAFRIIEDNGKAALGEGQMDYMSSKYKEKHNPKSYDFSKFWSGDSIIVEDEDTEDYNQRTSIFSRKFNPKKLNFRDENGDGDPIQSNPNSKYEFDNEDAIIVNLNNNKDN